jgi:hypothetical protein
MSTLSNGPQKCSTAHEVDAWLLAAQEQLAQLHLHAATPGQPFALHEAFTAMSALLQESFEEVRVVSESTREWSQGARSEAASLRTHSTQLMERSAALIERMSQFTPPPPEAIQEAESRMLALFKGDAGQRQA